MQPDFFADEIPLAGKKAHAAREARSPLVQLGWLFVVVLIGFAATSAAMGFGPGALEYLREIASRPSDRAPKSAPGTLPNSNPVWVSGNPQVIQPPPVRQFNIPQGNGFSTPFPVGRPTFSGVTIGR
jgi:hypothetical protein